MSMRSHAMGLGAALLVLGIAAAVLASGALGRAEGDGTMPDLVMSASGCSTSTLRIAATAERMIRVANEAHEPMVLSVPTIEIAIEVPAGGEADVKLHPYISGDYALYCVQEAAHAAAGGITGTAFVCSLDDRRLAVLPRKVVHRREAGTAPPTPPCGRR